MIAFATILTALPVTAVHASGKQYWTESAERVGYIEHVMNDGSIKSTFNEGHMKVEGEIAYCVDINTNFKNGYKTRSDASSRMSSDQIADVALSLEYVKQYTASHTNLNYKQGYLLEQCVVWQRLSEQLGWQCDNVRASYNEISQAVQNEVYAGAKAFVKANKGRYECGGYIYTGEGQFWAKLNVGNAKVKKTSFNPAVTDGNASYSFEDATFGVYSDKGCNSQLATLTADGNGDTKEVEVKAGTVYIKELSAPKGYLLDSTVHVLNVIAIDYMFYWAGRVYLNTNELVYDKEASRLSNVTDNVTENYPPSLISDGNSGSFFVQAFAMNARLLELGVECKLVYYPKTVATLSHGYEDLGSDYAKITQNRMIEFMNEHCE